MNKKLRLVEVDWVDSCRHGGWQEVEEYLEEHVLKCRSAGYLLRSNRKEVMLIQSLDPNNKATDSMCIPRSSVKKIRYLEVKEP